MWMPKIRKAFSVLVLVMVLWMGVQPVYAADPDQLNGNNSISGNLFNTEHEKTSDGSRAYYQIDVTSKDSSDEENQGVFETIGSWISGDAIKDGIMSQFYEAMNFFVNIMFKVNVYMTNMMLTVLNYAFQFDVVNSIIERLEGVMENITGISHGMFTGIGLFGKFIIAISVSLGLVFVYQYFFKKAEIQAVGTVAKTFVMLCFALIFFTNYGSILKGANNVTTELSAIVMGASSTLSSEDGEAETNIGDNMWSLFVHRPYLYMQYGTDNENQIAEGTSRVDALLKMAPGEERQTYVETNEVKKKGNKMMTYAQVPDRLVFTILYTIVNGITSLPIFALAVLIIIFQFWFLAIAVVAPFYLLIGAFPGQSGVFRRYIEELALPLILKIGVSMIALVVFTMSAIVYEVSNSDAIGYFATAFVEFIVLALIFLLRRRFMSILFAGGTLARSVAHEAAHADSWITDKGRDMKRRLVRGAVQAAGAVAGGPAAAAAAGAAVDGAMAPEDRHKSNTLENVSLADEKRGKEDAKKKGAVQDRSEDDALKTVPLPIIDPGKGTLKDGATAGPPQPRPVSGSPSTGGDPESGRIRRNVFPLEPLPAAAKAAGAAARSRAAGAAAGTGGSIVPMPDVSSGGNGPGFVLPPLSSPTDQGHVDTAPSGTRQSVLPTEPIPFPAAREVAATAAGTQTSRVPGRPLHPGNTSGTAGGTPIPGPALPPVAAPPGMMTSGPVVPQGTPPVDPVSTVPGPGLIHEPPPVNPSLPAYGPVQPPVSSPEPPVQGPSMGGQALPQQPILSPQAPVSQGPAESSGPAPSPPSVSPATPVIHAPAAAPSPVVVSGHTHGSETMVQPTSPAVLPPVHADLATLAGLGKEIQERISSPGRSSREEIKTARGLASLKDTLGNDVPPSVRERGDSSPKTDSDGESS